MTQNNPIPAFFINAFYESKFRDSLFVVKASGDIIEDDAALDSLICNIRDLTLHGIKILLVYGGGKAVDRAVEDRGVGTKRQDGRRVTDAATLDVMKEVIGGALSMRVYESMSRNYLEGLSFNAVPADWMKVDLRSKDPVDYGFVGDIKDVYKRPMMRKFKITNFMACSCLSITQDGQVCNINADTIATALAVGLSAKKLVFLSNIDGVKVNGETAFMITSSQIAQYIEDGTVTDGMKVKMENCLQALEGGVKRIHLINGLREDALYKEIFEPVGPGTMLLQDGERQNYLNEVEVQKIIGGRKT